MWLSEQEIELESLLALMKTMSTAKPLVCLLKNVSRGGEVERERFGDMPDIVFPGQGKLMFVIRRQNFFRVEVREDLPLRQSVAKDFKNVFVRPAWRLRATSVAFNKSFVEFFEGSLGILGNPSAHWRKLKG